MEPMPAAALKKLDLRSAAEKVAEEWRNFLPDEPWQTVMRANPGSFAKLASSRLRAGRPHSPSTTVYARKSSFAHRPVPILGPIERVVLQGLTDLVLDGQEDDARDHDAYVRFVSGPIEAARAGRAVFRPSETAITHVAEADVAAYYEYVDHAILGAELDLRTDKLQEVAWLTELLGEIQTRSFGLPQMLECSDRLADLYADRIRRDLRRQGYLIWRYNDDFRIGTESFSQAQAGIESLNEAAHGVGLTLNGSKTTVSRFDNYFWRHWLGDEHAGDVEFKPEDMVVENDYGELEGEGLAAVAHATAKRFDQDAEDRFDFDHLLRRDLKDISQMFAIATQLTDPEPLRVVGQVFKFVPQLSHRAAQYMKTVGAVGTTVRDVWRSAIQDSADFNAWQRAWLVHVGRDLSLFTDSATRTWLVDCYSRTNGGLLHAEACMAMAPIGLVSFEELDRSLRTQHDALAPWYVMAASQLPGIAGDQIRALRDSSQLYALLMGGSQ